MGASLANFTHNQDSLIRGTRMSQQSTWVLNQTLRIPCHLYYHYHLTSYRASLFHIQRCRLLDLRILSDFQLFLILLFLAIDQDFGTLPSATHAPPQKDVPMVQDYSEEEIKVWKIFCF